MCADIVKCVCIGVELAKTNFIISAHILCTNFSVFENPSVSLYMLYRCSVTTADAQDKRRIMTNCV